MMKWIFLLLSLVFVLEVWLLLTWGPALGTFWTIVWIVGSFFLGLVLLRVELKKSDPNTSYPTTPRLNVEEPDLEAALEGLANSQTILEENEYRDLLAKLSRPGIPRPLNILKNRVGDGALILQDDKGRLFAYINLLPRTAKRKRTVSLEGLMDTRTGEIMAGSTSGGDLFPLEGSRWHTEKFLSQGTLQSSRLIYDGQDFYFAATFQFEAPVRQTTGSA